MISVGDIYTYGFMFYPKIVAASCISCSVDLWSLLVHVVVLNSQSPFVVNFNINLSSISVTGTGIVLTLFKISLGNMSLICSHSTVLRV